MLGDEDELVVEYRRKLAARCSEMTDVHDRIRDYWDRDSHTYDATRSHAISDPVEAAAWRQAIAEALPEPGSTGPGRRSGNRRAVAASRRARLRRDGARPVARDARPGRAEGQERGLDERMRFVVGSATEPPEGPFDAVIERHVLWTLPDPVGALARWREVSSRLVLFEGVWGEDDLHRRAKDLAADGSSVHARPRRPSRTVPRGGPDRAPARAAALARPADRRRLRGRLVGGPDQPAPRRRVGPPSSTSRGRSARSSSVHATRSLPTPDGVPLSVVRTRTRRSGTASRSRRRRLRVGREELIDLRADARPFVVGSGRHEADREHAVHEHLGRDVVHVVRDRWWSGPNSSVRSNASRHSPSGTRRALAGQPVEDRGQPLGPVARLVADVPDQAERALAAEARGGSRAARVRRRTSGRLGRRRRRRRRVSAGSPRRAVERPDRGAVALSATRIGGDRFDGRDTSRPSARSAR